MDLHAARQRARDIVNSLASAGRMVAEPIIQNSEARTVYQMTLASNATNLLRQIDSEFDVGQLRCIAEKAVEARNVAMELSRDNLSEMGRSFSKALKETGKTLTELINHYTEKAAGDAGAKFEELTDEQKHNILLKVIEASGRSNAWVNMISEALGRAGNLLLIVAVATAVVELMGDEHPEVVGPMLLAERSLGWVLGELADKAIGVAALTVGFGPLGVFCSCLVVRVGFALGLKPKYFKLRCQLSTKQCKLHRRKSFRLVRQRHLKKAVMHNRRAIGGAASAGAMAVQCACLVSSPLLVVGFVAAGTLLGHVLDVGSHQANLTDDDIVLSESSDHMEVRVGRRKRPCELRKRNAPGWFRAHSRRFRRSSTHVAPSSGNL